ADPGQPGRLDPEAAVPGRHPGRRRAVPVRQPYAQQNQPDGVPPADDRAHRGDRRDAHDRPLRLPPRRAKRDSHRSELDSADSSRHGQPEAADDPVSRVATAAFVALAAAGAAALGRAAAGTGEAPDACTRAGRSIALEPQPAHQLVPPPTVTPGPDAATAAQRIPYAFARAHGLLPLREENGAILVLARGDASVEGIAELRRVLQRPLKTQTVNAER